MGEQPETISDEIIDRYLRMTATGRLVEVGAFNGENWSYTKRLIDVGWSALLFEPHPLHAELCRKLYNGNSRVIIDQCAIGKRLGNTHLYACGSLSTIKPEMIEVIKEQGYDIGENFFFDVLVSTLDEKLHDWKWKKDFELLVVDVEGAEEDVLSGFHIGRWGPHMCIIEACEECPHEFLTKRTEFVKEYFNKAGYKIVASDYFDIVFLRGDLG